MLGTHPQYFPHLFFPSNSCLNKADVLPDYWCVLATWEYVCTHICTHSTEMLLFYVQINWIHSGQRCKAVKGLYLLLKFPRVHIFSKQLYCWEFGGLVFSVCLLFILLLTTALRSPMFLRGFHLLEGLHSSRIDLETWDWRIIIIFFSFTSFRTAKMQINVMSFTCQKVPLTLIPKSIFI